jgi:arabinogalactan endo-1,4-beta-galactosidase
MKNISIFLSLAALLVMEQAYAQEFAMGVDLSYVDQLEDCGATYYDREGTAADPFARLSSEGANLVRLRLWHTPTWTDYSNLDDVKRAMARAKELGMQVMLDFHYSDFWADPSRQWRPAAWNDVSDDTVLGDSLYNYTRATLEALIGEDLVPSIVQLGNEINGNILIRRTGQAIDASSPDMYPLDWSRQVALLHRGIAAVKQVNTDHGTGIRTLIHVAQPENATWWFEQATSNGLTGYDIIGLSYYPQWSDFSIRELGEHVAFLASEYGREVMIVETGYPWTLSGNDYAGNVLGADCRLEEYENQISPEVQRDFMTELTFLVRENGGTGLVYWEPAWISCGCSTYWGTGSHYENAALFDFENRLNSGASYLSYDYAVTPDGLLDRAVSFRVNMQGTDTQYGVYVTGDFTGDPWQFMPMTPEEGDWYGYVAQIPGRSKGAYIFYNRDEWNNACREEVPSQCAPYWNTHRKYLVTTEDVEYAFVWGSCSHTVGTGPGAMEVGLRYLPGRQQILFGREAEGSTIRISNLGGQVLLADQLHAPYLDVNSLRPGLYFLYLENPGKKLCFKFSKQ